MKKPRPKSGRQQVQVRTGEWNLIWIQGIMEFGKQGVSEHKVDPAELTCRPRHRVPLSPVNLSSVASRVEISGSLFGGSRLEAAWEED